MKMDGIKQRKRKRKSDAKQTIAQSDIKESLVKRWNTVDIDENIFADGAVEGFMGLEEIDNYDEDELKSLVQPDHKKKKKTKLEEIKSHADDNVIDKMEPTSNVDESDVPSGITVPTDDTQPKKLNKKQRRKEQRKESFKLLLKERRKKRKELKKLAKEQTNSEIKIVNEETQDPATVESESEPSPNKSKESGKMSDWLGLGVPDVVLKALEEKEFTLPTPIQKETLPAAILHHKDIIGAAETGSGKTLAFGIPLVTHIIDLKARRLANLAKLRNNTEEDKGDGEDDDDERKPLYALILTPTRELALQIHAHINDITKYTSIKAAVVVGGLAVPKQERLLSKCPEIVIGTPGRLHKLMTNGEPHLNKFGMLRFLVIDECDRMLDFGHFKELNDIVGKVNSSQSKKQMFLFSATLTVPRHHKQQQQKKSKQETAESQLQNLIDQIGINRKAKVVDLTTKHVTATMLRQRKVMCRNEEKEMYLLYFLLTHPGRTIVFVNSIALTKKLCALLTLLGREPLQLHAGKQQRQRLKYLDRFVKNENGLLIATDVAARGLDIPKVQYVVHFQLPVDPKVYIHRAGRTARANTDGLSFMIQGTEDFEAYKKIVQVLKLGGEIESLDIDRGYLDGVKARVVLAKEIDKEEYKARKQNSDKKWMDRTAKSMEMELDEEEDDSSLTKKQKQALNYKKKQLNKLMETKLVPKGFSGAFPTRGGTLTSLGALI